MNKKDVLNKIDELCLLYENGILSHPYWYIPENKRNLVTIQIALKYSVIFLIREIIYNTDYFYP